jgi:hypothetical protein
VDILFENLKKRVYRKENKNSKIFKIIDEMKKATKTPKEEEKLRLREVQA